MEHNASLARCIGSLETEWGRGRHCTPIVTYLLQQDSTPEDSVPFQIVPPAGIKCPNKSPGETVHIQSIMQGMLEKSKVFSPELWVFVKHMLNKCRHFKMRNNSYYHLDGLRGNVPSVHMPSTDIWLLRNGLSPNVLVDHLRTSPLAFCCSGIPAAPSHGCDAVVLLLRALSGACCGQEMITS